MQSHISRAKKRESKTESKTVKKKKKTQQIKNMATKKMTLK